MSANKTQSINKLEADSRRKLPSKQFSLDSGIDVVSNYSESGKSSHQDCYRINNVTVFKSSNKILKVLHYADLENVIDKCRKQIMSQEIQEPDIFKTFKPGSELLVKFPKDSRLYRMLITSKKD